MNIYVLYVVIYFGAGVASVDVEPSFRNKNQCTNYAERMKSDMGIKGSNTFLYSCITE